MESINTVIERVRRTKPNAIEEKDQARWLLTLDGRVYEEVTRADEPDRLPCKEGTFYSYQELTEYGEMV